MAVRSHDIEYGKASIEALVEGSGPAVLMIASLGRPAQDFNDLAHHIGMAGFAAVRLQPRGIGGSVGPMVGVSLADLANDVAVAIEHFTSGPAVLIGHAFGQRIARMVATKRPDLVKAIVMLAAGGRIPVPQSAREALSACFDLTLPAEVHIENVRQAFFAPGNDPTVWRSGWYPAVAQMQREATVGLDRNEPTALQSQGKRAEYVAEWWAGGNIPLLIIQGLQDAVALPENGRLLKAEFGHRVELIEIDGAGHALLPEQPEIISTHVLAFLRGNHF